MILTTNLTSAFGILKVMQGYVKVLQQPNAKHTIVILFYCVSSSMSWSQRAYITAIGRLFSGPGQHRFRHNILLFVNENHRPTAVVWVKWSIMNLLSLWRIKKAFQ